MSDRIRHLEEGLQTIHSENASDPDQPHPLMQPALLGIKSTMGLYSAQATCASGDRPAAHVSSRTVTAPHHSPSDRQAHDERSSSEDTVTVPEHPVQVNKIH